MIKFIDILNEISEENLLYHSTDINNAHHILEHGKILPYEIILKNAHEDPADWYDDPQYGKYVYASDFMHTSDNYYGLADLEVTFVINKNKLKNKIIQADRNYEGGTVSILGEVPISAIQEVILHVNDVSLIELLKKKNIKYTQI